MHFKLKFQKSFLCQQVSCRDTKKIGDWQKKKKTHGTLSVREKMWMIKLPFFFGKRTCTFFKNKKSYLCGGSRNTRKDEGRKLPLTRPAWGEHPCPLPLFCARNTLISSEISFASLPTEWKIDPEWCMKNHFLSSFVIDLGALYMWVRLEYFYSVCHVLCFLESVLVFTDPLHFRGKSRIGLFSINGNHSCSHWRTSRFIWRVLTFPRCPSLQGVKVAFPSITGTFYHPSP